MKAIGLMIVCCISLLPRLSAQELNTFEVTQLKKILVQPSAEEGKKNHEQLGIEDLNTVDWRKVRGLVWNSNGRLDSLSWASSNLAGDFDLHDFTELRVVYCERNQLKTVSVKGATSLIYLDCYNNKLTTLDLTTNHQLDHVCCRNNELKELDLTHNPQLTFFCGSGNKFEQFDLSKNLELRFFFSANCSIRRIDFTHNRKLEKTYLRTNLLTTLDLSGLSNLTVATCYENALTTLDLSGCVKLDTFHCYRNQLTTLDLSDCVNLGVTSMVENKLKELILPSSANIRRLLCYSNALTFSTLPSPSLFSEVYLYSPQAEVKIDAPSNQVDLRSESTFDGEASLFTWFKDGVKVQPTTSQDALFSFDPALVGRSLECHITNAKLPDLVMKYRVTLQEPTSSQQVSTGRSIVTTSPNGLCFVVDGPMQVAIYSLNGTLVRQLQLQEGGNTLALPSAIYVVAFEDGTSSKVRVP